jgi:hypothetical protein
LLFWAQLGAQAEMSDANMLITFSQSWSKQSGGCVAWQFLRGSLTSCVSASNVLHEKIAEEVSVTVSPDSESLGGSGNLTLSIEMTIKFVV